MDNRLLSYDEKQKAIQKCHTAAEFENCITSAQLAKADKEWVEWIEKTFEITKVCTDCVIGTKSCLSRWCTYRNWQERKKELGL